MGRFDPRSPYNDLPLLPPRADPVETHRILKKCIGARVALAELSQAVTLNPHAGVLVSALALLEARASSEIANIVTTTDKLFEFAEIAEHRADPATREALRYRAALFEGAGMVQSRGLSTEMAIRACGTVTGVELDVRMAAGTTLTNRMTGEVIYTPPVGQKLLIEKLDNWAQFMHESSWLDPLIRLAVQHYQFEAIHPFSDGNGRTGRILNVLFLMEQGLLDSPILYLSRYIISNKAAYYRLLQRVTREQAWEPWILFVLDGIEETSSWTTEKVKAIGELLEHTARYLQARVPKIYSRDLCVLMFQQPCCRIGNLVDAGIAKRQTASVYLKQLTEIGVLREIKSGRENIFVHSKYIELLAGEENVWVYYAGVETDSAEP